ncbi:cytochrome P450 [Nonomuraea thailandensis]
MAAWHLFTDDALMARYREADEPERLAVLHEIVRLEPVVSRLRRRTTAAIELPGDGGPVTVPAGALVEVLVDEANTDPAAVGAEPLAVRPGRADGDGTGPRRWRSATARTSARDRVSRS